MRACWPALVALLGFGCDRGSPAAAPARDEPPQPVPATAPAPANDNTGPPLLWVVRGEAGTSYLQGTMHLGIDAERDLAPVVFELLDASRVFVMEADISDVDAAELLSLARLPEGQRLDRELTAAQWRRLTRAIPAYPEDRLRRFRPWFVIVAIAQSLVPQTEPMDAVLLRRAREAELDVAFLETWKYQIETIDEATGIPDLVEVLDNFSDTEQEMTDLAAGYRAGDAVAIAKILFDPDKYAKNPKVVDLLFTKRNKQWVPKLAEHFDRGGAFVAVGVGHMLGDTGLVTLLRERGFRVERYEAPAARPERRPAPAAGAP